MPIPTHAPDETGTQREVTPKAFSPVYRRQSPWHQASYDRYMADWRMSHEPSPRPAKSAQPTRESATIARGESKIEARIRRIQEAAARRNSIADRQSAMLEHKPEKPKQYNPPSPPVPLAEQAKLKPKSQWKKTPHHKLNTIPLQTPTP